MAAESWMFEKSRDEFVVLHLRNVLFLQGALPDPQSGGVHHLVGPELLHCALGHASSFNLNITFTFYTT